jgi:hypothetical protein
MTGSSLGENCNCFVVAGEEPSPTYGSFSFGALSNHLVFGFLGGIVPVIKINNLLENAYKATLDNIYIYIYI